MMCTPVIYVVHLVKRTRHHQVPPEVQTPSNKVWKLSPTQAPRDRATGLLPYGSGSKFESLDWRIRETLRERTIFDGKNM